MLKIVVHGDDHGTTGGADPAQQSIVLPVVTREADPSKTFMCSRQLVNRVPGVVHAPVVDQKDFVAVW
jgi:hypothetical protein